MFIRTLTRTAVNATPRTAVNATPRAFSTTRSTKDMARMNLIGHLVATPEAMTSNSGKTFFRYTIAVNARDANTEPSYYNVAAYLNAGEENSPRANLMSSLQKGTLCFVEADTRMITLDAREGEERGRRVLNMTQRNIQILSSKPPSTESSSS